MVLDGTAGSSVSMAYTHASSGTDCRRLVCRRSLNIEHCLPCHNCVNLLDASACLLSHVRVRSEIIETLTVTNIDTIPEGGIMMKFWPTALKG